MEKIKMTSKQTILITGATGNIGGGAAVSLAKRGARVVLLGRKLERLEARADSIRASLTEAQIDFQDSDITTLVIDFSDMDSARLAAHEALDRFPKIHGLVLSAVALVQNGPNILPNGHELMFATNVIGPFLFTQLMVERMEQSDGMVLHIINRTKREIDWDDLESIKDHKTSLAYERTKVLHRVIAGEMSRRYAGKISSVAFDPTFIIDKNDPELEKRWPSGFLGLLWKILTFLIARPPEVAGEPIADLMLSRTDRSAINGAMFRLDKRVKKPDSAMNDQVLGSRLWEELVLLTGPTAE
jgi:NAD(P)-dependent dehydrogenase (short-subunit alcohol dehydrogenase family)